MADCKPKHDKLLTLVLYPSKEMTESFQDYDTNDLEDFQETIMKGCDFNRDGKISKKELTMILLALSKTDEDE